MRVCMYVRAYAFASPDVDCRFLRGERVSRWYGSAVPYKSSADMHSRMLFCR